MAENVTKFQTFDGVEHDIEDSTARAGLNNVYTKSEADALLANKVDSDEVYSKTVLNAILDSKADEANVYSKTATDDLLAAKADAADVYTKTEADAALALKADAADVYTKTEADAALALKADAADVYTKTEADAALALKADAADLDDYTLKATFTAFQADVNVEFQNRYTKTEDDALLAGKANKPVREEIGYYTSASATLTITHPYTDYDLIIFYICNATTNMNDSELESHVYDVGTLETIRTLEAGGTVSRIYMPGVDQRSSSLKIDSTTQFTVINAVTSRVRRIVGIKF